MTSGEGAAIRRRDEILQVMYWLRGEGLAGAITPGELATFLNDDAVSVLAADLEALCGVDLVERVEGNRYRLSESGVREGGRRFLDEFAELMRPGHGACSDPECDCHTLGPEACAHA